VGKLCRGYALLTKLPPARTKFFFLLNGKNPLSWRKKKASYFYESGIKGFTQEKKGLALAMGFSKPGGQILFVPHQSRFCPKKVFLRASERRKGLG